MRITDKIPEGYVRAQPHEELFSEGGRRSVHHLGNGSRIWEKMNARSAPSCNVSGGELRNEP